MLKSRLLNILRTLEAEELEEFEKFLASPFHNSNDTLLKFYSHIRQYEPDFVDEELEKQNIFPYFFTPKKGETKDKYNRLRALRSRVLELLEEYLAIKALQNDELAKQKMLLQSYRNHSNAEEFSQTADKLMKRLNAKVEQKLFGHLDLHWLYRELFCHPELLDETRYVSFLPILTAAYQHLQNYHQWFILWLRIEAINSRNIHEKDLKEVLALDPASATDNTTLALYQGLYLFLTTQNTFATFEQLWKQFQEHIDNLSALDRSIIFSKLINYCKRPQGNQPPRVKKIFELYQFAIKHKIYAVNDKIYFPHFILVVTSACMYQQTQWARTFVASQEELIIPRTARSSAINLAYGFIYFYEQNFSTALSYLNQQLDIPHSGFELVARSLLLRTQYEVWQQNNFYPTLQTEADTLKSNCRNFTRFLTSKKGKIPERRTAPFSVLIKRIKGLIRLKLRAVGKGTTSKIFDNHRDKLLQENQQEPFFASSWVQEKIKQIA